MHSVVLDSKVWGHKTSLVDAESWVIGARIFEVLIYYITDSGKWRAHHCE